jgi:EF-hand domain pair
MELLAKKIEERFAKVSDAYIYFATYAAEHQGYKAK